MHDGQEKEISKRRTYFVIKYERRLAEFEIVASLQCSVHRNRTDDQKEGTPDRQGSDKGRGVPVYGGIETGVDNNNLNHSISLPGDEGSAPCKLK
jgi:hypothetical protein